MKYFFISFLICSTVVLNAQELKNTIYVAPGNNSCHAALLRENGYISFPIPPGMTLSQLTYLGTDFQASAGYLQFLIQAQTSCGPLNLYVVFDFYSYPTGPNWVSTGNLVLSSSEFIVGGCSLNQIMTFGEIVNAYGNATINIIRLADIDFVSQYLLDNTIINSRNYNYDDCDGDGLRDIYDCDPNTNGNYKVLVCHNGNTICISQNALGAHLAHGDYEGACYLAPMMAGETYEDPDAELWPDVVQASAENEVSKREDHIHFRTFETQQFQVYPNPASNEINIYRSDIDHTSTVMIADNLGKVVSNVEFMPGQNHLRINVDGFAPGVYLIAMKSNNSVSTKKLLISRP